VPTSVLLAVLAAAGLLALAPALVRRYDATERLAAERAQSTARVLDRRRRQRTVPGPRPMYAPRLVIASPSAAELSAAELTAASAAEPTAAAAGAATVSALEMSTVEIWTVAVAGDPSSGGLSDDGAVVRGGVVAAGSSLQASDTVGRAVWLPIGPSARGGRRSAGHGPGVAARTRDTRASRRHGSRRAARRRRRVPQSPEVYRRRRVLASLIVFNAVELIGVFTVSPGFWTGFAVTSLMLVGYLVHLRNEALSGVRTRRVAQRRAAVVAAVQAEIRVEQARRAAERRDALRRAAAARAAAQREAVRLTQRYVDFDPSRRARVRGRSYESGGWDGRAAGQ
jgi:hypothetical protein